MFRNDQQLAAVCQALCRRARLGLMWTAVPPAVTPACKALLRRNPHSHGERLLYDVAWALWNGRGKPDLYELVHVLDSSNLAAVGKLLTAIARGPAAIDSWLKEYAADPVPPVPAGRPQGADGTPPQTPASVQQPGARSDALARVEDPDTSPSLSTRHAGSRRSRPTSSRVRWAATSRTSGSTCFRPSATSSCVPSTAA